MRYYKGVFMLGKITVRPRGFRIISNNYRIQQVIDSFCYHVLTETQYKKDPRTGEGAWHVKDTFYLHDKDNNAWYFHVAFLEQLKEKLRSCGVLSQIEIEFDDINYGVNIETHWVDGFKLKPEQVPYHSFITKIGESTRILPATMGAGKTITAMSCIRDFGARTITFIEPKYKDTWIKEAEFVYGWKDGVDIRWVSGSDDLIELINDGLQGNIAEKLILLSLNTAESYFSNPEKWCNYPVEPWDFFETIGVGYRIDDEAHSWLKFRCILDSLSNCAHNIYLTATLTEEYKFRRQIENAVYPAKDRCPVAPPEKHVTLVAESYHFDRNQQIPWCCGSFGYQHHKLENYLLKRKWRANNYYFMILQRLKKHWYYSDDRKRGYKVLVYFATTKMVEEFVTFARLKLPDVKIGIAAAGTGDEAFKQFEVIAATPKKAGTGVDIPKLSKVFDSVMVNKTAENMQKFGRIRGLKKYDDHEGIIPMYLYWYSPDIKQHRQYDQKRFQLLGDLAKDTLRTSWDKPI